MKYLKQREEFVKNNKFSNLDSLNEAVLANDIAWGDSLLGRLINSVIRKAGVGVNLLKMDSVIQRLKDEFEKLVAEGKIEAIGSKEITAKVEKIKVSATVGKLKTSIVKSADVKTTTNIIKNTIGVVKHTNVPTVEKEELLVKLDELLKSVTKEVTTVSATSSTATEVQGATYSVNQQVAKPKDNKIQSLKDRIEYEKGQLEELKKKGGNEKAIKDLETQLASSESALSRLNHDIDESYQYVEIFNLLEKISNTISSLSNIESNRLYKYSQFINEQETIGQENKGLSVIDKKSKEVAPIEKTDKTVAPIVKTGKEVATIEKTNKEVSLVDKFNSIFTADYMEKWSVSKEESKKLEATIEKSAESVNSVSLMDPIVEIVKIFNNAHKIYVTPTIQSGRTDGKVSNKTFREYSWVGDGNAGSPKEPSVGAWRNNALFDKWENEVLDIIKNPKYQVIFNEKTTFKFGKADRRINVDKTKKQGGGKTLLKFMNDMLDGERLYKKGAQARFIEEYFGVQISERDLGLPEAPRDNKRVDSKEESAGDVDFVNVDKVIFERGQALKIDYFDKENKPKSEFAYVYSVKDGVYLKIGRNSNLLKAYLPTGTKIKTDIGNTNEDIYFVKLNINSLSVGDPLELKYRLNIYKHFAGEKPEFANKITLKTIKKISLLKKKDGKTDYIIGEPEGLKIVGFDKKDSGKITKGDYDNLVSKLPKEK